MSEIISPCRNTQEVAALARAYCEHDALSEYDGSPRLSVRNAGLLLESQDAEVLAELSGSTMLSVGAVQKSLSSTDISSKLHRQQKSSINCLFARGFRCSLFADNQLVELRLHGDSYAPAVLSERLN
jgi:hypothetical protein